MEEDKVILVYPGFWAGPVFQNREEALVFVSLRTSTYKEFLDEVHKLVQVDRRVCEYVLHCFIHVEDGPKKSFIMSDRDLQRVAKIFRTPKIYVSFKPKHLGMNAPNHEDGMFDKPEGTSANPYPFPYWPAPYIHGVGPSSAPCFPAPWGWPGSAPVIEQLGPGSAPAANQPKPGLAPIANQPKPGSAPVIKPSSKPAGNNPKPNTALAVNQPKPVQMSLAAQTRLLKRALDVKRTDYRNDEAYKRRILGFKVDGCPTVDEEFYSDDESSC